MRIMALDIGQKRIGIAISDAKGTIASPLKVLSHQDVISYSRPFRTLIEDYEPELLLAGLPVSLDGEENSQARWVREQIELISNRTGIPFEFFDERLSSLEAKRIMREQGLSERDMRGKLDMLAASIFLQAYLDTIR